MRARLPNILNLSGPRGLIILGSYGVGTTFVAVLNLGGLDDPVRGIIEIVLLWGALACVASVAHGPLAPRAAVYTVIVCSVLATVASTNLSVIAETGYAAWHMGAITFIYLVLAVRGRPGMAWIGFGIFTIITVVWSVLSVSDTLVGVNYAARQAATLLIGTLFALLLRRSALSTEAINARHLLRSAEAAAYDADITERVRMLARLETHARPALNRIVAGAPFTDKELQDFALLEAGLRDGIRAAGFTSPEVAREIRAARARGVSVTLLDDRGSELVTKNLARVEEVLIAELQRTQEGTLTARLSPAARDEIATVVVGLDGRFRRIVVTETDLEISYLATADE